MGDVRRLLVITLKRRLVLEDCLKAMSRLEQRMYVTPVEPPARREKKKAKPEPKQLDVSTLFRRWLLQSGKANGVVNVIG